MKRNAPAAVTPQRRSAPAANGVAIIGTGLIGTSIGLALRARSPHRRVIGYDREARRARAAMRRGALTEVAPSLLAAARAAGVVVLALPQAAILSRLHAVMRAAPPKSMVIDVAGLKTEVVASAARELRASRLVGFAGGHPMAGSHEAGPEAAQAKLFAGRPFALCIPPQRGRSALERRARAFVRSLGAVPVMLDAREHDRQVALTSALPQVVASATVLAAGAARGTTRNQARGCRLVGPGFASVTRLAASPEALWKDALLANRANVVPALRALEGRIRNFRTAVERCDDVQLGRLLRTAAVARRRMKSS